MLWLLLLACTPKAPVTESAAVAEVKEVPAAESAAAPVVEAKPKLPPLPASRFEGDTIDPNAWRRKYNDAVRFQNAGDGAAAYKAASEAVALAPLDERGDALVMLAITAGEVGDRPMEFAATDALLAVADAPWGVFWNAALDANGDRDLDRAADYALQALKRGGDPAMIQGFAVSALTRAGRCPEAKKLDPEAC